MFEIVLGHFINDYILQSKKILTGKYKFDSMGWWYCFIHSISYTLIICSLMNFFNMFWMILIFYSHFIIDKFSLTKTLLYLIETLNIEEFIKENRNTTLTASDAIKAGLCVNTYRTVNDILHISAVYFIYVCLFK